MVFRQDVVLLLNVGPSPEDTKCDLVTDVDQG